MQKNVENSYVPYRDSKLRTFATTGSDLQT